MLLHRCHAALLLARHRCQLLLRLLLQRLDCDTVGCPLRLQSRCLLLQCRQLLPELLPTGASFCCCCTCPRDRQLQAMQVCCKCTDTLLQLQV